MAIVEMVNWLLFKLRMKNYIIQLLSLDVNIGLYLPDRSNIHRGP